MLERYLLRGDWRGDVVGQPQAGEREMIPAPNRTGLIGPGPLTRRHPRIPCVRCRDHRGDSW